MAINRIGGGAVIIAGSGMCNGGRVRHHLKYNLWRRQAHLVICGFQASRTLGRSLVDGARRVRLLGAEVAVNAKVHTLGGFSAHAGQDDLVSWAANFSPTPRVWLVHGEPQAAGALAQCMKTRVDVAARVAERGKPIPL